MQTKWKALFGRNSKVAETVAAPAPRRIEICGVAACGKTTLARAFSGTEISAFFDDERIPFWEVARRASSVTQLDVELTFLLHHYTQIDALCKKDGTFILDFSLFSDLAHASTALHGAEWESYTSVFNGISHKLPPADLVVHLKCDPMIASSRMRSRGKGTDGHNTIEKLCSVASAIDGILARESELNLVVVDGGAKDFVDDELAREAVVQEVREKLGQTVPAA